MKCPACGADNPDDKRFCGDCGSQLGQREAMNVLWQKRLAKQTGLIFVSISVLLIIIALGIKGQSDSLSSYTLEFTALKHALHEIAVFLGWLGVIGFLVSGLAYLFSLPTPPRKKTEVTPAAPQETQGNLKSG